MQEPEPGGCQRSGMNAIPNQEMVQFLNRIDEAVYMARNGRVAAGYGCLEEGRQQVEELIDEGGEWAADLEQRYRDVEARFTRQYGAALLE